MRTKFLASLDNNIQLSQLKDITPYNFQYPTKYPCTICYQRCSQPITCSQCNKSLCLKHADKLKNKCPTCRLTPFVYFKDIFLKQLTQNQVLKQRDILISKATFTCLIQGCNYRGKYHKMDLHRRKNHRNEQLKDILFVQQRQKKKRKQIIQRLFLKILLRKQNQMKIKKKAQQICKQLSNRISAQSLHKMLWHILQCDNKQCKQIYYDKQLCFIGDKDKNISDCLTGKKYFTFLSNN